MQLYYWPLLVTMSYRSVCAADGVLCIASSHAVVSIALQAVYVCLQHVLDIIAFRRNVSNLLELPFFTNPKCLLIQNALLAYSALLSRCQVLHARFSASRTKL